MLSSCVPCRSLWRWVGGFNLNMATVAVVSMQSCPFTN